MRWVYNRLACSVPGIGRKEAKKRRGKNKIEQSSPKLTQPAMDEGEEQKKGFEIRYAAKRRLFANWRVRCSCFRARSHRKEQLRGRWPSGRLWNLSQAGGECHLHRAMALALIEVYVRFNHGCWSDSIFFLLCQASWCSRAFLHPLLGCAYWCSAWN